jgi:hypothetical protein
VFVICVQKRSCERVAAELISFANSGINVISQVSSPGFLGFLFKKNFKKSFDFFRSIVDALPLNDPHDSARMLNFIRDLVGEKCGLPEARSMTTERIELLDTLWKKDTKSFLIAYKAIQEHFKLEARLYESQLCKFLASQTDSKDVDHLVIQAKLSQNHVMPITDMFFKDLGLLNIGGEPLCEIFRAIVDSQKHVQISSNNAASRVKKILRKKLSNDSFMFMPGDKFYYEAGRLCGFIFEDTTENFDFIGTENLEKFDNLNFCVGYLDQVKSNSSLEKKVFADLHSTLFVGFFPAYAQNFGWMSEIVFRAIKLNIAGRSQELCKLLKRIVSLAGVSFEKSGILECLQEFLGMKSVKDLEQKQLVADLSFNDEVDSLFLSILIDRWSVLSEIVRHQVIEKVQSVDAPDSLKFELGLSGCSKDMFLNAVESTVFKAQAAKAFEVSKQLSLEESVHLKIAAHWFFVDGFEEISKYHSVSAFLSLCA